jgi:superfamily I DNA/RNA helicase
MRMNECCDKMNMDEITQITNQTKKEEEENNTQLDYLNILKALKEIPFGVGKKLLIDFLVGNAENKSIKNNHLTYRTSFGSMQIPKKELSALIDNLALNKLITLTPVKNNKFWKVYELTKLGEEEISKPKFYKKKLAFNSKEVQTQITEKDREIFSHFNDFLDKYNDNQKKAIINDNDKILCVAGAGTGKTTVLTKRVEFLVKYKSVPAQKILAITFTRKAKEEMQKRLARQNNLANVNVETFNSFSERILRINNNEIYQKNFRVINYREKIELLNRALRSVGVDGQEAIDLYFSRNQKNGKTDEQLFFTFLNDCFFIIDYYKYKRKQLKFEDFSNVETQHMKTARMIFGVCNYIKSFMKKKGLRDFTDQIIDTIKLFKTNPEKIPEFKHVLVDEFQDINSSQIELIDLLNTKNLFCVGDPRQSIFGWRGSDIQYILNFEDKYPNCEVINLTTNYRSAGEIVKLINKGIKDLGLADLESGLKGESQIKLKKFDSESQEHRFIINKIEEESENLNEIFVLARTNKQLEEFSNKLQIRNIDFIIKTNEFGGTKKERISFKKNAVTLATIHAIKGLEAENVFIMGCSANHFPCKGSEHPIIDMIKIDEYDKEEEEKRLFYVAMSRAKKNLYMTYTTKNPTYFINDDMQSLIKRRGKLGDSSLNDEYEDRDKKKGKIKPSEKFDFDEGLDLLSKLKEFRTSVARQASIPPYMVFHDKTLVEIAKVMPKTREELLEINGMGPKKYEKYGDLILEIINLG